MKKKEVKQKEFKIHRRGGNPEDFEEVENAESK
jgi:hypothetical protein